MLKDSTGSIMHQPTFSKQSVAFLPNFLTKIVWLLFLITIGLAFLHGNQNHHWTWNNRFTIDGLTLVMWIAATFFSGIVHSYSLRYMAGNHHINQFFANCFGFTLAVMLLTASDHLLLFILGWLLMGLFMARLIGHNRNWGEARLAGRYAMWYFIASTLILIVGSGLLVQVTGHTAIASIISALSDPSGIQVTIAALLMVLAAIIQSAIFPFQSWLMSSMTTPTPASALMHAGFVNAGGILLTRFAPLIHYTDLMGLIVIIGGIGALFGKFWKFAQSHIKRKLGCSTVSQMGFMLLQCGLGFFSAAVTHLVLHGFYKAYSFLSSGSRIEHTIPSQKDRTIAKGVKLPVILISGVLGGWLFTVLTGKGLQLNSGALLTFVVVLTIIHGTQDIIKRTKIPIWIRLLGIPLLIVPAVAIYALFFNTISGLLQGMPLVEQPTVLTWHHGLVTGLYLMAFLAIEFEWYKKSKRLYVGLLNVSQPNSHTVLKYKN